MVVYSYIRVTYYLLDGNIMKKIRLSVLFIFGFIGIIEVLSAAPSNKEQDIDIDKHDEQGKTQLHRAVWNRDIEAARILINKGANLNVQDKGDKQETPLHIAVFCNDLKMAKLLVDAKADVNIENYYKNTPLGEAVANNKIEMVKLLIDAKADVNKNECGNTPLHVSINGINLNQSNIEITKLLIAAKADINIQNTLKNTPLHEAVSEKNIDMVKLLLAANANVNLENECGANPLLHCLRESRCYFNFSDYFFAQIEIIKLLINAKSNVNLQFLNTYTTDLGKTALHFAVNVNNIPAVKLLLAAKANKNIPDAYGKTALYYAQTQEMKDLLNEIGSLSNKEQNMDMDIDHQDEWGKTQLHRAVWHRDSETVRILINKGANLNIQDQSNNATPLYIAVNSGDLEIVKLLLNAKADVNIQNTTDHRSSLHEAVCKNNIEIVKLLISANANVNTLDQYGNTALHMAIQRNNIEIEPNDIEMVKLLIDAKADVNIQNNNGEALLHEAIYNIEIMKLLIDAKADINIQVPASSKGFYSKEYIGKTALHFAVKNKKVEIIKLLLAAKANKNIKDNYGKIALDYAQTQEIKDILRNKWFSFI